MLKKIILALLFCTPVLQALTLNIEVAGIPAGQEPGPQRVVVNDAASLNRYIQAHIKGVPQFVVVHRESGSATSARLRQVMKFGFGNRLFTSTDFSQLTDNNHIDVF